MTQELITRAKAILSANDRGGYTVPTHGLYPFQWNWDSAFVAMGFATYDIDRALRELERLAEGQWADGMIPQIIFHAPSDTYFPGPDVWGTKHHIATSGITQPPVFAMALKFIAARADRRFAPRIRHLFSIADRYHRWFALARDPAKTGMVATLHNWETGRDNSPEWDIPFARVPDTTATPLRRRDTGHVDASMRPTDADYRRYIHLVDLYRSLDWNAPAMFKAAPFRIADIGTNAILLAAEEALLSLADAYGSADSEAAIQSRIDDLSRGLAALWHNGSDWFLSRDLVTQEPIAIRTSAGFLPLLTRVPSAAQVRHLEAVADAHLDQVAFGIASTLPGEPGYEPRRYWRGPVWAIMNWMIAEGFSRHGRTAVAARIKTDTLAAISKYGFGEYFDPSNGEALGGEVFSWTASVAMLIADASGQRAAA